MSFCFFSQETCLARIVKGLQLHLNLLKEITNSPMLPPTDHVNELEAEIEELLDLIKKVWNSTW